MAKSKASGKSNSNSGANAGAQKLEEYMKLMSRYGIAELEVETSSERFALRTKESFSGAPIAFAPQAMTQASAPTAAVSAPGKSAAPAAGVKKGKEIKSPFVGTFYRSPAPGKEPYVKVGQNVESGAVLCIIEAMKLMNEIEADFGGKVLEILAEDGQPVEFGEPLFLLDPS